MASPQTRDHNVSPEGIGVLVMGSVASASAPSSVTDGNVVRLYVGTDGRLHVVDDGVSAGDDDANGVKAVAQKPLVGTTYAPLLVTSFAAATDINVRAGPANVMAITGENRNAATRYFQLHNTASAIAGAAVPTYAWPVPAGTTLIMGSDFFTNPGAYFATGCRAGWSTTEHTYTAATAADHTTHVHYI